MPASYHSHQLPELFRICHPEKGAGPSIPVGRVAESSLSHVRGVYVFIQHLPELQRSEAQGTEVHMVL